MFGRKRIKNCDVEMSDISQLFFDYEDEPTLGVEYLQSGNLDYSLESLSYVNEYLDKVRQHPSIRDEWNSVVLRCGAYVGEVIRRNSTKRQFHWMEYKEAVKLDANFERLGLNMSTTAVLCGGGEWFCFPLGKVGKYLESGSGEDVQYFAQVAIDLDSPDVLIGEGKDDERIS